MAYRFGYIAGCLLLATVLTSCGGNDQGASRPWNRHVIDDSSAGADGLRLWDVNDDGLPDIATGWEEGGQVRVCLHPGMGKAKSRWPSVVVGTTGSPEDAVFADLDGDQAIDVVSCSEGNVRTVFFHWAPPDPQRYLDPAAWRTEALPASKGRQQWMFCLPMQVDGRNGVDLVVGGKNDSAQIGWFEAPANAHALDQWKWHPLYDAGWIMSLIAEDIDGDGDLDVVASDRKGPSRGCLWIENPGAERAGAAPWPVHRIGASDKEFMFLTIADLDDDGLRDLICATAGRELVFYRRLDASPIEWERFIIDLPRSAGTGKGVAVADLDLDGHKELVFSCEHAEKRLGVMGLRYRAAPTDRQWASFDVSGSEGVKFDLVELADLDFDGDLDVVTTEETQKLGVIWYENPQAN